MTLSVGKPTPRYHKGELEPERVIEFLEEYRAQPALPPTKKSVKRGELLRIRGIMRQRFPGYQTNILMLNKALDSRPEWLEWKNELVGERKAMIEDERAVREAAVQKAAEEKKKKRERQKLKPRMPSKPRELEHDGWPGEPSVDDFVNGSYSSVKDMLADMYY